MSSSNNSHTESTSDDDSSSLSASDESGESIEGDEDVVSKKYVHEQHHPSALPHLMMDDPFIKNTLQWALSVPIGLGLCPWAIQSHREGKLRIVKCDGKYASDVADKLENEISDLTCNEDDECGRLRTTLVVCPHVKEWDDFQEFGRFVSQGIKRHISRDQLLDKVTLVAFHPNFLKWYGLPRGIELGSIVHSYWGSIGQKSTNREEATIVELENKAFGLRKIKVRFTNEIMGRQEQYVPVDWIDTSSDPSAEKINGDPLPDNFMYQSPYPVIHIINNNDLSTLCLRDVSRVKRLNAKRMLSMGWKRLKSHIPEKYDKE
eukprot:scaffold2434_cov70-Cyclotella_meneghiniana.AAC.9